MSQGTPVDPRPLSPPPPPSSPPPGPPPAAPPAVPPAASVPPPSYGPPAGSASTGGGMPTWGKIAIGCGCATLLAVVLLFVGLGLAAKKGVEFAEGVAKDPAIAAEAFVKFSPDYDLVESDREAGTMTVRETATGKEMTVSYEDIKNGKIQFEDADGKVTDVDFSNADGEGIKVEGSDGSTFSLGGSGDIDDLPSWLPVPNGATSANTMMSTVSGGEANGIFQAEVPGDFKAVATAYSEQLEGEGFTIERSDMNFGGQRAIVLAAKRDGRQLNASVTPDGDDATLHVTYEGPAE